MASWTCLYRTMSISTLKSLPKFGSAKTCEYHDIAVQCGPRGLKGKGDTLWHNNGDGTFTEVAKQAGVDDAKLYFGLGALWSDFDNDGLIDLLVANDGEPNYLYRNLGHGRFQEVGTDAGVAFSEEGTEQANMGLAVGDYTRTGNMSIAISHFSDEYMELYRNDGKLNFTDVAHSAAIAKSSIPYVGWGDAFLDVGNRGLLDLLLGERACVPAGGHDQAGAVPRAKAALLESGRRKLPRCELRM